MSRFSEISPLRTDVLEESYTSVQKLHPKIHAGTHCFFSMANEDNLATLLAKPYQYYIEVSGHANLSDILDTLHVLRPDFCLSISSSTTFRHPVSEFISNHIQSRFSCSSAMFDAVKTCLQESLLNAVIHGNLNIHQVQKTPDDFNNYYEHIITQLEDRVLSQKRVNIMVWNNHESMTLCVSDEGKGFSINENTVLPNHTAQGRGLLMIRSLATQIWQTLPNTLFMKFNH